MNLTIVILLILIGILLLLVEFFLTPGVTVAGIGGVLMITGGIYMAYNVFGNTAGNYTLLISLLALVVVIVLAFRSNTWDKIALSSKIDGKVETDLKEDMIKPGDEGETISRLAPIGKAQVNGVIVEAKSLSGYIDPHIKIQVVKVLTNQIIVKPKI